VEPLLVIENLSIAFSVEDRWVPVVRDVEMAIGRNEFVGLVGESGSGKTLTALSILGLLPSNAVLKNGRILLSGEDLLRASSRRLRKIRGRRIAMIFQEPASALNPVLSCGFQIRESLWPMPQTRSQQDEAAQRLLALVGLPPTQEQLQRYPHEMSGGQRQRLMIAMALAGRPEILLADEPTSALDSTLRSEILELLVEVRERFDLAILLITHDLTAIERVCDRCVVMYAGQVVEQTSVERLFSVAAHPYSKGLIAATPHLGATRQAGSAPTLPGQVPDPGALPSGCAFRTRCPEALPECAGPEPVLKTIYPCHQSRCLLNQPGGADGDPS
jgi:peptide/nickel transport system ATP-binding protein